MPDFNLNIWAPWRMEYIRSLEEQTRDDGCFLCHYWQHPRDDDANLVVWRRSHVLVVLNRFPYTNGHLLIAPPTHVADLTALDRDTLAALQIAAQEATRLLTHAIHAEGFNIGYNVGRCAGAGLPDHLHAHVVPRWSADTNYMAVLGGVRVVPDGLRESHRLLVQAATELGLRDAGAGGGP